MRVLCLDVEGGHGGSSRSLLQFLEAMDRNAIDLNVICRRPGWIEDAYRSQGVPCMVAPEMPKFTALERFNRNAFDLFRFTIRDWPQSKNFRNRLLAASDNADLVHCNHISLFLLARWLRNKRPNLPITMHIRTRPNPSAVANWQARLAKSTCDGFVFISENEHEHFNALLGTDAASGPVIYNPVAAPVGRVPARLPEIPDDSRLKVLALANYSYDRGLDRLIDIAAALPPNVAGSILFVVAGDIQLSRNLPDMLGRIGASGGTLADYAAERGVSGSFLFLGHVNAPERALAAADLLLKPTRENNPWGRDILEALSAGCPVASVGRYSRFVETGVTGLLQEQFNAAELARWLEHLSKNRQELLALGRTAAERIAELCEPRTQARKLASFWQDAVTNKNV